MGVSESSLAGFVSPLKRIQREPGRSTRGGVDRFSSLACLASSLISDVGEHVGPEAFLSLNSLLHGKPPLNLILHIGQTNNEQ